MKIARCLHIKWLSYDGVIKTVYLLEVTKKLWMPPSHGSNLSMSKSYKQITYMIHVRKCTVNKYSLKSSDENLSSKVALKLLSFRRNKKCRPIEAANTLIEWWKCHLLVIINTFQHPPFNSTNLQFWIAFVILLYVQQTWGRGKVESAIGWGVMTQWALSKNANNPFSELEDIAWRLREAFGIRRFHFHFYETNMPNQFRKSRCG